eukprot:gb/GECG01004643.1/.p1 GENE.gb/GECG01004643.1/~~gb/GECG01004643.1/.p1  ORF type:complete len:2356 (+),score=226.90 gb/GECG01004643.1/:1-7068(+)
MSSSFQNRGLSSIRASLGGGGGGGERSPSPRFSLYQRGRSRSPNVASSPSSSSKVGNGSPSASSGKIRVKSSVWVYLEDIVEFFYSKYRIPSDKLLTELEEANAAAPFYLGTVVKLAPLNEGILPGVDSNSNILGAENIDDSVAFVRLVDAQPFGSLQKLFEGMQMQAERIVQVKLRSLCKAHGIVPASTTDSVRYSFMSAMFDKDNPTMDVPSMQMQQLWNHNLSYLLDPSSPEVLLTVTERFKQGYGYTSTGRDLISIRGPTPGNRTLRWPLHGPECMVMARLRLNPHKALEWASVSEVSTERGFGPLKEPHIFLVAERALFRLRSTQRSQAILLTGTTGSGKSDRMKNLISYVCHVPPIDKFLRQHDYFGFRPDENQNDPDVIELQETGITQLASRLHQLNIPQRFPEEFRCLESETVGKPSFEPEPAHRKIHIPLSIHSRKDSSLPLDTSSMEFKMLGSPVVVEPFSSCSSMESPKSSRMTIVYDIFVASRDLGDECEKLLGMGLNTAMCDFNRPSIAARLSYACKKFCDKSGPRADAAQSSDSKSCDAEETAIFLNALLSAESTYQVFYWLLAGASKNDRSKLRLPSSPLDATILTGVNESDIQWRRLNIDIAKATSFTQEAHDSWSKQYELLMKAFGDIGFEPKKVIELKQLLSAIVALADLYVISKSTGGTTNHGNDLVKISQISFRPERRLRDAAQLLALTPDTLTNILLHSKESSGASDDFNVSLYTVQRRIWDLVDVLYEVVWNFLTTNLNGCFAPPPHLTKDADYLSLKIVDTVGEKGCLVNSLHVEDPPSPYIGELTRHIDQYWPCGVNARAASNYCAERLRELEHRRISAAPEDLEDLLQNMDISENEVTDILSGIYSPTKIAEAYDRTEGLLHLLDTLQTRRPKGVDQLNRKISGITNIHKDVLFTDLTRETSRNLGYSLWVKHSIGKAKYPLSQILEQPGDAQIRDQIRSLLGLKEEKNVSGGQSFSGIPWQNQLAEALDNLNLPKPDISVVHCIRPTGAHHRKPVALHNYQRGSTGERLRLINFLVHNLTIGGTEQTHQLDFSLIQRQLKSSSLSVQLRFRSNRISLPVADFVQRFSIFGVVSMSVEQPGKEGVISILQTVLDSYKDILRGVELSQRLTYDDNVVQIEPEILFLLELLKRWKFRQMDESAVALQHRMRAWAERRYFLRMLRSVVLLQATFRQWRCQHRFLLLRDAVAIIEASYLGYQVRRRYLRLRRAVASIKSRYLTHKNSRRFACNRILLRRFHALALGKYLRHEHLRRYRAAVTISEAISKFFREKKTQWRRLRCALLIQAFWRGEWFRNSHRLLMDVLRRRLAARLSNVRLIRLQAHIRRKICQRWFSEIRDRCITLQRWIRTSFLYKGRLGAMKAAKDIKHFLKLSLLRSQMISSKEDIALSVNLLRIRKLQQRENKARVAFNSQNAKRRRFYYNVEQDSDPERFFMKELRSSSPTFQQNKSVGGLKIFLQCPFIDVFTDVNASYPQGWTSVISLKEKQLHKEAGSIEKICSGSYHSIILDTYGRIYSFGINDWGQCGVFSRKGVIINFTKEVVIDDKHVPHVRNVLKDGILRFSDIATGTEHTIALSTNGVVVGWGSNRFCQLGTSEAGSYSAVPRAIPRLSKRVVTEISSGSRHCVARTKEGDVYCWGNRDACGLGNEGTRGVSPFLVDQFRDNPVSQVSCGWDFTVALTAKKQVFVWGSQHSGEYFPCLRRNSSNGLNTVQIWPRFAEDEVSQWETLTNDVSNEQTMERIFEICAGSKHILLMSDSYSVWSLGDNHYGQCGFDPERYAVVKRPSLVFHFEAAQLASTNGSLTIQMSQYIRASSPKSIRRLLSCGWRHSCCMLPSGESVAWGAIGEMYTAGADQVYTESGVPITYYPTTVGFSSNERFLSDRVFSIMSPSLSALFIRFQESISRSTSPGSPGKIVRFDEATGSQNSNGMELNGLSASPSSHYGRASDDGFTDCLEDARKEVDADTIVDSHCLAKWFLQKKPFQATAAQLKAVLDVLRKHRGSGKPRTMLKDYIYVLTCFAEGFATFADGINETTFVLASLLREIIRVVLRHLRKEIDFGVTTDSSAAKAFRVIHNEVLAILPETASKASSMDPCGFAVYATKTVKNLDHRRYENLIEEVQDVDDETYNLLHQLVAPPGSTTYFVDELTAGGIDQRLKEMSRFPVDRFLFARSAVNEVLAKWSLQAWAKNARQWLNRLVRQAYTTYCGNISETISMEHFDTKIAALENALPKDPSCVLTLSSSFPYATEQRLFPGRSQPLHGPQVMFSVDGYRSLALATSTAAHPFQLKHALLYSVKSNLSNEDSLAKLSELESQLRHTMKGIFGFNGVNTGR